MTVRGTCLSRPPGWGTWTLGCLLSLSLVVVVLGSPAPARAANESVGTCAASGEGGVGGAKSVAVDYASGDVYVASGEKHRVTRYDSKCEFVEAWGVGVADGEPEFQTCGEAAFDAGEAKYPLCADSGEGGHGEVPGAIPQPEGVAIDQETGAVFVLDNERKTGVVQEFSADGERLIASFGEPAPFDTSVKELPAEIHGIGLNGLAVGAHGKVYVVDVGGLTGKEAEESRVMVFGPKSAADEEYTYEGEFGKGFEPEGVWEDASEDFFVSNEKDVYKLAHGALKTAACKFTSTAGLAGMTGDPVTGSVYVFGYKKDLFYELNSKCENSGEFKGVTGESSTYGLALDPYLSWGPDRPDGVLYAVDSGLQAVELFAPALAGTPPVVSGLAVSGVTGSGATLEASVNPEGFETEYYFEYGPEGVECSMPGACAKTAVAKLAAGTASVPVSAGVSGLTPGTAYHFRVLAVSHCDAKEPSFECVPVAGATYESFTTTALVKGNPPAVSGLKASGVTQTEAKLEASVNPEGFATEYYFEYGPEGANCDTVGECVKLPAKTLPKGSASVPVSTGVVTGLTPGTAYKFRVIATSHCNEGNLSEECVSASGAVYFAFSTSQATHEFPLIVNVVGSGKVSSNPVGIDGCDVESCMAEFEEGTVTLTAVAEPGYVFVGWLGCRKASASECKVVVSAASEVTAVFLEKGKEGKKGEQGTPGAGGKEGPAGKEGSAGQNGAQGSAGSSGLAGAVGAAGPGGPAGPAGKEGPPGKVQVVTCTKVGKKKKCTTKTVSGTVSFSASTERATLSRHGLVYARGAATSGAHGGLRLRVMALHELHAGRYTLTLTSGSGRHEHIRTETFTLS
jgi:hypothetical protein